MLRSASKNRARVSIFGLAAGLLAILTIVGGGAVGQGNDTAPPPTQDDDGPSSPDEDDAPTQDERAPAQDEGDDARSSSISADATDSLGFKEALAKDAEWYASGYGVSQAEAERRLMLQLNGTLSDVIERLEDAAPGRFGGAFIQHRPDFAVVARYEGDPGELSEVHRIAEAAPVQVHIEGNATSLKQMRKEHVHVEARVADVFGRRINASVHEKHNAIVFYVDDDWKGVDRIPELEAEFDADYESAVLFDILVGEIGNGPGGGGRTRTQVAGAND